MSNRRNFLKTMGLGVAAVSAAPVKSNAFTHSTRSVKVGILVASSQKHPSYPESFLNGFSLACQTGTTRRKIELITESVPFGYPSFSVLKTRKLIEENGIDLFVGLVGTETATFISEVTVLNRIPALIANAGENYCTSGMLSNPYLIHSTLNLQHNAALAAEFMVDKFGKKLAIVAGLHDAGYDMLYAFQNAAEQAGGTVQNVFVNKQEHHHFHRQTIQKIKDQKSDGVFVFMHGKEAEAFFQACLEENLSIPKVTHAFVGDETNLMQLGSAAQNIYHVSSWNKNLENEENQSFVSAYKNKYRINPDQFGFLGFQTGLVALRLQTEDWKTADSKISFESPAGILEIDTKSGLVNSPAYLCKTVSGSFSLPECRVLSEIKHQNTYLSASGHKLANMHSGWINPYLFV